MIDQVFKDYEPTYAEGDQAFVDGVLLEDNPYTGVYARWWARGWCATRDLSKPLRGKS